MVKTFRRDVIKAMQKDQEYLRKKVVAGKLTENEVIFGVVKRHSPSNKEFSYIRMPIQVEQNGEPNYYSMKSGKNEIRLYNKKNIHRQELHSLWTFVIGPKGKEVKRPLLQIVYGDFADEPMKQSKRRIEGEEAKLERLLDKKRRGRKVKVAADALERRIYA